MKAFLFLVENQTGLSVKRIRSARGGEYLLKAMKRFFTEKGIVHEPSNSCQPQQNGVAQRLNRTLCEKARCMLFYQDLSRKFWRRKQYKLQMYYGTLYQPISLETKAHMKGGPDKNQMYLRYQCLLAKHMFSSQKKTERNGIQNLDYVPSWIRWY